MEEEIKKQKYRQLLADIKIIKNEMNELQDARSLLKQTVKENFLVNDKVVYQDVFSELKKNNNSIINELTNTVIPRINDKI